MNPDSLDLLREFSRADVRFMLIGAYAVGVHGHPRATKDLDVWVEASADNAPRVLSALRAFGAPLMGLRERDLLTPGKGLRIGVEPARIDVLTKISGVDFSRAWPRRVEGTFGDVACSVIALEDLLACWPTSAPRPGSRIRLTWQRSKL